MTRTPRSLAASLVVAFSLLLAAAQPSHGIDHLMQIEQVIGGVDGDTLAQAVQLRMRFAGQNQLNNVRLRAWDAAGANPILVIDYAGTLPVSAAGSRILATTPQFNAATDPAATPDFTITNRIPASYLAAGSLTFETDAGTLIYWRFSWGGASYTGSGMGAITNDADGNFNPPFPGPLPSTSTRAVRFLGAFNAPSTNNSADYAVPDSAAEFINNAGASFIVQSGSTGIDPAGDAWDSAPFFVQREFAPNPFTAETRLDFRLAQAGTARLLIADVSGRRVAVVENALPAGSHSIAWDGRDAQGARVAPGAYVYRLEAGGMSQGGRLVLVR